MIYVKIKVKRKSQCPLCKEGEHSLFQIELKLDTLLRLQEGLAKDVMNQYERIRYCIYCLENRKGV